MKNDSDSRRVIRLPREKGLVFYAHKKHARAVFDCMIKRLVERGQPYNRALVPQVGTFLPRNLALGGREHAVFLFMLCLWMRGGIESNTAAAFLRNMYEKEPELFDPSLYLEDQAGRILHVEAALKNHRLGQRVDENSVGWVYNMRKLALFWNGDPRKLMDDQPAFAVLVERIRSRSATSKTKGKKAASAEDGPNGFMFFREKMVAMIAYFLIDAGLVPVFYTPVPVDFHVLRLLTSNQILRVRGKGDLETIGIDFMTKSALRAARDITEWYCRTYRISPVALCDALWLLSRTLCRENPGNSGYVRDEQRVREARNRKAENHAQAELGLQMGTVLPDPDSQESEVKGRKRYQGLKWSGENIWNESRRRRFERTCGICPVRHYCRYNISAGAYYVGGNLLPERRRLEPSDHQGHFLGHEAFLHTTHAPVHDGVRFSQVSI